MVTILINFQEKFALVRSFQHFAIKFRNQKDFAIKFLNQKDFLKSALRSSLSWRGKCDVFFLKLLFAIARSKLARKNDVTDFGTLYMHVQK